MKRHHLRIRDSWHNVICRAIELNLPDTAFLLTRAYIRRLRELGEL